MNVEETVQTDEGTRKRRRDDFCSKRLAPVRRWLQPHTREKRDRYLRRLWLTLQETVRLFHFVLRRCTLSVRILAGTSIERVGHADRVD